MRDEFSAVMVHVVQRLAGNEVFLVLAGAACIPGLNVPKSHVGFDAASIHKGIMLFNQESTQFRLLLRYSGNPGPQSRNPEEDDD
jgi:hypothetical protein